MNPLRELVLSELPLQGTQLIEASVGVTTHPNHLFMMQIARNLTDVVGGFLLGKCYLILDRDTKYSAGGFTALPAALWILFRARRRSASPPPRSDP